MPLLRIRSLSHLPKPRSLGCFRFQSSARPSAPKEFKVVLDNETLYVDEQLAEALGWDASKGASVPLTLSGWAPHYFAIARTGSDSDCLAQKTAESSRDPKVQKVLEYLKDR